MDGLSLGLGGAQLGIQVFESVVKGFRYFEVAANADSQCRAYKLRLRVEYARIRQWSYQSGLVEQQGNPGSSYEKKMGERRLVALVLLSELKAKLREMRQTELRYIGIAPDQVDSDFESLDASLSELVETSDDISDEPLEGIAVNATETARSLTADEWQAYDDLIATKSEGPASKRYPRGLNHLVLWSKGISKMAKQPKRFAWALKHNNKMSQGIDEITVLVGHLLQTLSQDQIEQVLRETREIRLVMTTMNKTLSDMTALQQASQYAALQVDHATSKASLGGTTLVPEDIDVQYDTLSSEASFKKFMQQVLDFSIAVRSPDAQLDDPRIQFDIKSDDLGELLDEGLRQSVKIQGRPAWVEWKSYTTSPYHVGGGKLEPRPSPEISRRAAQLATLLNTSKKPAQFAVPPFVGFFNDVEKKRFGYVFEPPASSVDAAIGVSLSYRLSSSDPADLHERIAISQQLSQWLLYLHTADWLHKGLQSRSIIFFPQKGLGRYGQPFVTGYEYSRAAGGDSVTNGPPETARQSFHIHPEYLEGKRFRKTFDIYSLGIILVELALWRPIDSIIASETKANGTLDPGTTSGNTRELILEARGSILKQVEQAMGKKYSLATRACIEGMSAFGLSEDKIQADPLISGLLQQAYIRVVVNALQGIMV